MTSIDVDVGTRGYLLDLERGIAYSPAWPATWTTGGELTDHRIAWVVGRDRHGDLLVSCPHCRTARGNALLHTHGPTNAADGIHDHRVSSCGGYIVIDRGQLERHLEQRDSSTYRSTSPAALAGEPN